MTMMKVKLTKAQAISMVIAAGHEGTKDYPGAASLPGVAWSSILAMISADNELTKIGKSIDAARDVKNLGENLDAEEAKALIADLEKWEEERKTLCEKHAKKGKDGKPAMVTANGSQSYDIPDMDAFNEEAKALQDTYQTAIDARNEQLAKVSELLEEEVELSLPQIKQADLPATITPAILRPFAKLMVSE